MGPLLLMNDGLYNLVRFCLFCVERNSPAFPNPLHLSEEQEIHVDYCKNLEIKFFILCSHGILICESWCNKRNKYDRGTC